MLEDDVNLILIISGASPPNPHPLFKKSGAKIIKKSRKARFLMRFFSKSLWGAGRSPAGFAKLD